MAAETPLTAAEIYTQITGGEGSQSLSDAERDANHLTSRMVERAQRISSLRAKTMSGWQGGAGQSAADATLPLVQAAGDDAVHLETAQAAVGAQMDAFGTAKNSVKPVAAQPPQISSEDVHQVLSGEGFGTYNTKVAGWQADSQANIDAFSAYHSASGTNGGQMPAQYAQLTDSGAPIGMASPGDGTHSKTTGKAGPTDTGEWARNPRQTQVPSQQNRQTVQPGQNQVQDQVRDQVRDQVQNQYTNQNQTQNPNQAQQPDNDTHANSYVPKPVMPPAAQGGYEFGPTGQPGGNFGGSTAFGPGTGGYSGGFGPGSGYQPGTQPGTGYRPGTGPGTPGTNLRGPGANTGARMPEERLPGGAPARGAAGARGANGMPMGSPAGGRGGKEEDKEKKTAPYLRNPDPDETFGGFTEKPMPPVIGEHRPKN
ncbi:PPE domain-containing protein [Amycolatopsis sp. NPDC048633]|uniref:PPE domain-containing protein n=1 Tax=Amycolatopsis sp. NPDC048633 TaxID=3157095 RepID=UPI003403A5D5